MPRDTTKEAKQKTRSPKGRMNQGGAAMPGKASARAQALGMEKDTRPKTGAGPNRGHREEEGGRLTRGAPAARRANQKGVAKAAGKGAGRKAPARDRRRSQ